MMTTITIREQNNNDTNNYQATVSFNNDEFQCRITNPCSSKQLVDLDWYFKEYSDPDEDYDRAKSVACSITKCGQQLFKQVFCDKALRRYDREKSSIQCFNIVGSPAFHSLPWETLYDPDDSQPLALDIPIIRQYTSETKVDLHKAPIINLLIVTARPHREKDINYRAISRPLVESLRQAKLRVNINILRPSTIRALQDHLSTLDKGYYHIIHLDVHGALQGDKSVVFLESAEVEATQLAQLLVQHQIPITILNACESGKQVGISETSLSGKFMEAGMPLVLAMRYTVTVTAATFFMKTLYQHLFDEPDIATAIRYARNSLYNNKERRNAYNEPLELEEWIIPVVYQNTPTALPLRDFLPDEQKQREAYDARDFYPNPEIVGRDLDILEIETKIAQRNILLIRGCTGIGKTTLVKHLAWWWQNTYDVTKVFYFGYDEKLWTQQQVLQTIAQALNLAEEQATIVNRLVRERHLLIFDALECINTSEENALHDFLMRLQNGKSLILLGSQQKKWLDSVYELTGIDNTSANILIKSRLKRHNISYLQLEKNPLLLKIAILAEKKETALLSVLQAEMTRTDIQGEEKQQTILRAAINYIYNKLTSDEQGLLLCLAPLKFAININTLSEYSQRLRQHAVLAHLPFDDWEIVLEKMFDWRLLRLSPDVLLQSAFGDFLGCCLVEKMEWRSAIEMAFGSALNNEQIKMNPIFYTAYDNYWVGRAGLISELSIKLREECPVLILTGITGIGKTALAERLIIELQEDWTEFGRINFDIEEKTTDFFSVAIELLSEWGEMITQEQRKNPQKLLDILVKYLQEHRCLILFDSMEEILKGNEENGWSDFEDVWWIKFFQRLAEKYCQSKFILTSQDMPGQLAVKSSRYPNFLYCQSLTGLDEQEQLEFFRKTELEIATESSSKDYLVRIGMAYEGHPLALRVVAGEIGNKPFSGNVVAYWNKYGYEIVEVEKAIKEAKQGKTTHKDKLHLHKYTRELRRHVRVRIEKTFNRLKQDVYYAYVLLCEVSVYRCPVPEDFWLSHLEDWDYNKEQQKMALDTLRDRYLVEDKIENNQCLLRLHNLIRSVALEQAKKLDNEELP